MNSLEWSMTEKMPFFGSGVLSLPDIPYLTATVFHIFYA